jgi:antitoxin component YwqK of YwqJK toxin-antitoxin module
MGLFSLFKDSSKSGAPNDDLRVLDRYPDGEPHIRGRRDDKGLMQGAYIRYYRDGTIMEESRCHNDMFSGLWTSYHANKNVAAKGLYEAKEGNLLSRRVGNWTWFYSDGQMQKQVSYEKGLEVGDYISFHRNGKSHEKGRYEKGRKEGYWETRYENGNLEKEGHYSDSAEQGEWTFYHDNRSVKSQGRYENGEKEGTWTTYDRDGLIAGEETYRGGIKHGRFVSYAKIGQDLVVKSLSYHLYDQEVTKDIHDEAMRLEGLLRQENTPAPYQGNGYNAPSLPEPGM